jgi:hypothetical protein
VGGGGGRGGAAVGRTDNGCRDVAAVVLRGFDGLVTEQGLELAGARAIAETLNGIAVAQDGGGDDLPETGVGGGATDDAFDGSGADVAVGVAAREDRVGWRAEGLFGAEDGLDAVGYGDGSLTGAGCEADSQGEQVRGKIVPVQGAEFGDLEPTSVEESDDESVARGSRSVQESAGVGGGESMSTPTGAPTPTSMKLVE